jgi:small redox-active disulfide protein 2
MRKLQVLGSGCARCSELAERTQAAARALALEYELEKVNDLKRILGFGVMRTPALVVDGAVKMSGRVPSIEELKGMLG